MQVIRAKVIGFKIRENTDYKLYFATAGIIKGGTGNMCLHFCSRESLKVGEEIYVTYATKQLPDGKVFKSWEFVKF